MAEFSRRCTTMGAMRSLRSITLTLHQHSQSLGPWFNDVMTLLAPAPLEVIQMYSVNTFVAAPVTNRFWSALVTTHGGRLKRFAVHRMMIGLDAIRDICERCVKLEQLFIVIAPAAMVCFSNPMVQTQRLSLDTNSAFIRRFVIMRTEFAYHPHQPSSR